MMISFDADYLWIAYDFTLTVILLLFFTACSSQDQSNISKVKKANYSFLIKIKVKHESSHIFKIEINMKTISFFAKKPLSNPI